MSVINDFNKSNQPEQGNIKVPSIRVETPQPSQQVVASTPAVPLAGDNVANNLSDDIAEESNLLTQEENKLKYGIPTPEMPTSVGIPNSVFPGVGEPHVATPVGMSQLSEITPTEIPQVGVPLNQLQLNAQDEALRTGQNFDTALDQTQLLQTHYPTVYEGVPADVQSLINKGADLSNEASKAKPIELWKPQALPQTRPNNGDQFSPDSTRNIGQSQGYLPDWLYKGGNEQNPVNILKGQFGESGNGALAGFMYGFGGLTSTAFGAMSFAKSGLQSLPVVGDLLKIQSPVEYLLGSPLVRPSSDPEVVTAPFAKGRNYSFTDEQGSNKSPIGVVNDAGKTASNLIKLGVPTDTAINVASVTAGAQIFVGLGLDVFLDPTDKLNVFGRAVKGVSEAPKIAPKKVTQTTASGAKADFDSIRIGVKPEVVDARETVSADNKGVAASSPSPQTPHTQTIDVEVTSSTRETPSNKPLTKEEAYYERIKKSYPVNTDVVSPHVPGRGVVVGHVGEKIIIEYAGKQYYVDFGDVYIDGKPGASTITKPPQTKTVVVNRPVQETVADPWTSVGNSEPINTTPKNTDAPSSILSLPGRKDTTLPDPWATSTATPIRVADTTVDAKGVTLPALSPAKEAPVAAIARQDGTVVRVHTKLEPETKQTVEALSTQPEVVVEAKRVQQAPNPEVDKLMAEYPAISREKAIEMLSAGKKNAQNNIADEVYESVDGVADDVPEFDVDEAIRLDVESGALTPIDEFHVADTVQAKQSAEATVVREQAELERLQAEELPTRPEEFNQLQKGIELEQAEREAFTVEHERKAAEVTAKTGKHYHREAEMAISVRATTETTKLFNKLFNDAKSELKAAGNLTRETEDAARKLARAEADKFYNAMYSAEKARLKALDNPKIQEQQTKVQTAQAKVASLPVEQLQPTIPAVSARVFEGEMSVSELAKVISDNVPGTQVDASVLNKNVRDLETLTALARIIPAPDGKPLTTRKKKWNTYEQMYEYLHRRVPDNPVYHRIFAREGAPIPAELLTSPNLRIVLDKPKPFQVQPQVVIDNPNVERVVGGVPTNLGGRADTKLDNVETLAGAQDVKVDAATGVRSYKLPGFEKPNNRIKQPQATTAIRQTPKRNTHEAVTRKDIIDGRAELGIVDKRLTKTEAEEARGKILSPQEAQAVNEYNSPLYVYINNYLRTGDNAGFDNMAQRVSDLDSALTKLPNIPGEVYRGEGDDIAEIVNRYKEGEIITIPSYISTSTTPDSRFIEGKAGKITIWQQSAVDIFNDEVGELLLPRNLKFKVASVRIEDGKANVLLRQVVDEPVVKGFENVSPKTGKNVADFRGKLKKERDKNLDALRDIQNDEDWQKLAGRIDEIDDELDSPNLKENPAHLEQLQRTVIPEKQVGTSPEVVAATQKKLEAESQLSDISTHVRELETELRLQEEALEKTLQQIDNTADVNLSTEPVAPVSTNSLYNRTGLSQEQLWKLSKQQELDENVNLSDTVLHQQLPSAMDIEGVNLKAVRKKADELGITNPGDTDEMVYVRYATYRGKNSVPEAERKFTAKERILFMPQGEYDTPAFVSTDAAKQALADTFNSRTFLHGSRLNNFTSENATHRGSWGVGTYLDTNTDNAINHAVADIQPHMEGAGRSFGTQANVYEVKTSITNPVHVESVAEPGVVNAFRQALYVLADDEMLVDSVDGVLKVFNKKVSANKDIKTSELYSLVERAVLKHVGTDTLGTDALNKFYSFVSDALRTQGYDAVYSANSVMVLDPATVRVINKATVSDTATPLDIAAARYNVESMRAKESPDLPTAQVAHMEASAKLQAEMLDVTKTKVEKAKNEQRRLLDEMFKIDDELEELAKTEKVRKSVTKQRTDKKANEKQNRIYGKKVDHNNPCNF